MNEAHGLQRLLLRARSWRDEPERLLVVVPAPRRRPDLSLPAEVHERRHGQLSFAGDSSSSGSGEPLANVLSPSSSSAVNSCATALAAAWRSASSLSQIQ